ncbi:MAG: sulfite exporter TauE/SafE family protein [Actinomycetales bacterium]|nr:MAG: sulfite exporter TauE/SafE family protein [Actinomycetales bacterium]
MEIALALIAGTFIGSVLGFIGAGGAMLTVPILIYVFNFTPIHATTAALAVVFLAALSGVIPKLRKGEVLVKEALSVWGLGLITNLGGAILAKHLSDTVILTGFASILIAAGLSMLRAPIEEQIEKKIPFLTLVTISLVIGSMTGVFGIGGGFLAIPVLVLGFHTPHHKAAGTSLLIIALNCATSFLAHASVWSQINWNIPITIATSAVLVSLAASHQSSKIPTALLRQFFAYLLFAIAIFTIMKTWFYT